MKFFLLWSQGAFAWTWKTSACASLLVVLVLLAQQALGQLLTARLRYTLSLLVLIRLLLPIAPASRFSVENLLPGSGLRAAIPAIEEGYSTVPGVPFQGSDGRGGASLRSLTYGGLSLLWATGCLGLVAFGGWRYRQWNRWIQDAMPVTEPALLDLLDSARQTLGVRRPITLVAVEDLASPAVFGVWHVRLLLPQRLLGELTNQELRMIFLHEMAHVRRGDILLNCLLIAIQFLHWFNPLVWLAQHRLRADREMVCDAMVLARVRPEDHVRYGEVLLKLVDEFSAGNRPLLGAVPVVASKHEIKRRIIMIKHHSRAGFSGFVATAVVVAALCGATFTRAQQDSSPLRVVADSGPEIRIDAASYDLGTVDAGDIVKHTFIVANTGDRTLEISRVQPSCGCTTAGNYTRKVEPGRTGAIPIQFNSANKSGPVTKTIQVLSNARNQPKAILTFKCKVKKLSDVTHQTTPINTPPLVATIPK